MLYGGVRFGLRYIRSYDLLQAVFAEAHLPLVYVQIHGLYALYLDHGAVVNECFYFHGCLDLYASIQVLV